MANKTNKNHPFKNTQMPLHLRLVFSGITMTFKILGLLSPKLAGRYALYLFLKPPKFRIPKREIKFREEASLSFIEIKGNKISVRRWGEKNKPTVLLSHGWGGRSSQLHAFIHPLVEAGYQVIGFELPGHGDSQGSSSNMLEAATIIQKIADKQGSVEAIIGHSFGSATALFAMDKFKVKAKKVILVSCFSEINWVLGSFGSIFSLRATTLEALKELALKKFTVDYKTTWTWDELSPQNTIKNINKNTHSEFLLIHDEKDYEVPFEQAKLLQEAAKQASVMITSGLGHRKILMSKKVSMTTLEFIKK